MSKIRIVTSTCCQLYLKKVSSRVKKLGKTYASSSTNPSDPNALEAIPHWVRGTWSLSSPILVYLLPYLSIQHLYLSILERNSRGKVTEDRRAMRTTNTLANLNCYLSGVTERILATMEDFLAKMDDRKRS